MNLAIIMDFLEGGELLTYVNGILIYYYVSRTKKIK